MEAANAWALRAELKEIQQAQLIESATSSRGLLVCLVTRGTLVARMLLVAPGITTRNKKLLAIKGIATRNKVISVYTHCTDTGLVASPPCCAASNGKLQTSPIGL